MFTVDLKHHKGMMRGVIEAKRRSFSSWVWMGPLSLGFFLEGIEKRYLDTKEEHWVWSWKEEGRSYQMTKDGNRVGPFVSLKVIDVGRKFFSIIVPEGGRNGRGWREMAELLRELSSNTFGDVEEKKHRDKENKKKTRQKPGPRASASLTGKSIADIL